jgi:hypothetical protein
MPLPNRLLIGPVIGLVTPTTARILVEMLNADEVNIALTAFNDPAEHHYVRMRVPTKKPAVFRFEGLRPDTKYSVRVEWESKAADDNSGMGRVRTFSQVRKAKPFHLRTHWQKPLENRRRTQTKVFVFCRDLFIWSLISICFVSHQHQVPTKHKAKIGVLSCNDIFVTKKRPQKDMWRRLRRDVFNDRIDILFHIGDQASGSS